MKRAVHENQIMWYNNSADSNYVERGCGYIVCLHHYLRFVSIIIHSSHVVISSQGSHGIQNKPL